MRLKHSDPSVESGLPYKYSQTGRDKVGDALTQIVSNTNLGGTIALTGQWGSGKTTFLRMWNQDLNNQGFPTVTLNAWQTEWAEDPLIAVIARIQQACERSESQETLDTVKEIAKQFRKRPFPLIWAVAKTVLASQTGVDASSILQQIDSLSDCAFDEAVSEFDAKHRSIEKLKNALEKLAWKTNPGGEGGRPLVFIIDELDRCKPDYAVRLLEVLKHLFEVRNIVFVCAIDKKHLEDSVRGFYGSDRINAQEYLRRFFDLEVELPAPDYEKFCKHLYEYYDLGAFFDSDERNRILPRDEGEEFQRFLSSLAVKSNMSLRQVDRICAFTKVSLQGSKLNTIYFPSLSLFITYLRFFNYPFYQSLQNHEMTAQELLDRIVSDYGELIDKKPEFGKENNHRIMLEMIGRLIVSYNNDRGREKETVFDSSEKKTSLNSSFFTQEELNDTINWISTIRPAYQLSYLFRMLDVLQMD